MAKQSLATKYNTFTQCRYKKLVLTNVDINYLV